MGEKRNGTEGEDEVKQQQGEETRCSEKWKPPREERNDDGGRGEERREEKKKRSHGGKRSVNRN